MDWKSLFFSFQGRLNRAKYWLAVVIIIVVDVILQVFRLVPGDNVAAVLIVNLLVFVLGLAVLVASVAIGAKRLHDRDKSAWWLLLFYLVPGVVAGLGVGIGMASDSPSAMAVGGIIAAAIGIWAFVELGCLRGTPGSNRYGADPLGSAPAPAGS